MKRLAWFTLALAGLMVCGCAHHKSDRASVEPYSTYTKPLRSPGAQFGALPPAVQRTVRAEAGATQISDIVKYKGSESDIYGIFFQNSAAFPPLFVAADGSVMNRNMTVAVGGVGAAEDTGLITGGPVSRVTLNDLPAPAVQTIHRLAPDAVIDTITRETHGEQADYIVTFKENRSPALEFNRDGDLINPAPVRVRTK